MTKLNLSETEPEAKTFTSFWGAFKATVENAKIVEEKKDKNGKPFYKIEADVVYGEEKVIIKRLFGMLPFQWKTNDPLGQLYTARGTKWENLLGNFEKETSGDITVLIGAGRNWKDKTLRTYTDGNGVERISYDIIGFAPYGKQDEAWTEDDEEREQSIYDNFTNGAKPEKQPGFEDDF